MEEREGIHNALSGISAAAGKSAKGKKKYLQIVLLLLKLSIINVVMKQLHLKK